MRRSWKHRNGRLAWRVTAAAVLLLLAAAPRTARAAAPPDAPGREPAETLPTDHPVWRDLEYVWTRGGLTGLPLFTRPLVRADIARAVAATRKDRPDLAASAPFRRILREFAPELRDAGAAGGYPSTPPLLEIHEDDARLMVRGEAAVRVNAADDDVAVEDGAIGGLVARAYLPRGAFALVDLGVEKILDDNKIGDAIAKGSDWYLSSTAAYLSVRTSAVDLSAGLLRNRWGPGRSGTLLLSDAALSYPALFYGRTFGKRLRFVALTGALHQPEQRWFSAHRLEVTFGENLQLGLQESAAYASRGLDLLYAVGLVPYTLVQRMLDRTTAPDGNVRDHRNNVMTSIDAVWRLGGGFRLDGELLIDDLATETSTMPHRLGFQGGLAWAGSLAGDAAEARAEFVKVYRYTYATFYGADHIRDDVALGYGPGNDREHAEFWLERDFGTDARLGGGIELTRQGEGRVGDFWDPADPQSQNAGAELSGTVERTLFPHLRAEARWRDVLVLRARVGAALVDNPGNSAGEDNSFRATVDTRIQW